MENNTASSEHAAYIPCYSNGNSVLAVLNDGSSYIIDRNIKHQLAILFSEHNIDIRSMRKNFSSIIGRSSLIPIPLNLDILLIPVKVRKPIIMNDGSYAYIVLSQIKQVTNGQKAIIKLNCGYEINSLESSMNINWRIFLGNKVREKYALSVLGRHNLNEGISGEGSESTRPATKGDLYMLAYEIMKLRRTFEMRGGEYSEEKGEKE